MRTTEIRIIISFLVIVLLQSCYGREHTKDTVVLDLDHPRTEMSMFDFCSSVRLVQLDNNPEALVSPYSTVYCVVNDKIYILDGQDHCIKIFNTDGNWIESFTRYGRADNEYSMVESFLINRYRGTIDVLNPIGEIMQYSLSPDHSFLNRIELPDIIPSANTFSQIADGKYVIYSAAATEYYLYDASDNRVKSLGGVGPFVGKLQDSTYGPTPPFVPKSGQCFVFLRLDGTVYTLDEGENIVTYLSWDTGSHRLSAEDIPEYDDSFSYYGFLEQNIYRYPKYSGPFFVNDKYVIVCVLYKGLNSSNCGYAVYDKEKDEAYYIEEFAEGGKLFFYYYDSSYGIGLIPDNRDLSKIVNDTVLKDERSREILHSVSDDDNAVMILYSFE